MDEAVAKLNIAHLRSLLAKPDLTIAKLRAVQKLLTQEEQKLDKLTRS
jgi:hypothetical protein